MPGSRHANAGEVGRLLSPPPGATRSCAFVYYSVLASDENDLRCATGTPTPVAQIKRKSTRKPSANQRANHFPKDVRYFRNEAQTILSAAQTILPACANHFASLRKPFCAGRAGHFALARKPFGNRTFPNG